MPNIKRDDFETGEAVLVETIAMRFLNLHKDIYTPYVEHTPLQGLAGLWADIIYRRAIKSAICFPAPFPQGLLLVYKENDSDEKLYYLDRMKWAGWAFDTDANWNFSKGKEFSTVIDKFIRDIMEPIDDIPKAKLALRLGKIEIRLLREMETLIYPYIDSSILDSEASVPDGLEFDDLFDDPPENLAKVNQTLLVKIIETFKGGSALERIKLGRVDVDQLLTFLYCPRGHTPAASPTKTAADKLRREDKKLRAFRKDKSGCLLRYKLYDDYLLFAKDEAHHMGVTAKNERWESIFTAASDLTGGQAQAT